MSNAKHQRINFQENSGFDNSGDPVTKIPFVAGESVVACRDKNSLISLRSLESNEYICPFCSRQLDSSLAIIGSAKIKLGKKPEPTSTLPVQSSQRQYSNGPLIWASVALVALICVIISAAGVFAAISSLGSEPSSPEAAYSEQPNSTPTQKPTPRYTDTPLNTARPKPTKTLTPQSLGSAEVSDEIYFAALRKSPGYVGKNDQVDVIVKVPSGSVLTILGGPKTADGIKWWYVKWGRYEGWMAERTGSGKTILIFK